MHPSLPKYVRLIESIKADIHNHILRPQQQLPNEDTLAAKYGVSRGTVRKALAELQRQGLIRIEQGRGTFVNGTKPTVNGFSLVEFDQYLRQQNRAIKTETLSFETITATPQLAERLACPSNSRLFHITQRHLIDNVPSVYEERYFQKSLCPTLTQENIANASIHWVLIKHCQIPLLRIQYDIEIIDLPKPKQAIFETTENIKVFAVHRLSFTQVNEQILPAIWYQALYRTDEYYFRAQFHNSI
ncbi:MAG: hypothetical protein CUN55_12005 [Phototrophicales bacterium]|nr:MAG: hypothetical protein CUN55_12005 [Phototrophicales bacterium]